MRTTTVRWSLTLALAAALVLAGWAAPQRAAAQLTGDVYSINYFDVDNGDNAVRIVNPSPSNLCANIYLFDPQENMQTCCSCAVSSDGYFETFVDFLLQTGNASAEEGAIKLVSTRDSIAANLPGAPCDPTTILTSTAPQLRAWVGHSEGRASTETAFAPAPPAQTEALKLQRQCKALLPPSPPATGVSHICSCAFQS